MATTQERIAQIYGHQPKQRNPAAAMTCPECDSPMEKCEGTIVEETLTPQGTVERKGRPAVYFGCLCCEYHQEVTRA